MKAYGIRPSQGRYVSVGDVVAGKYLVEQVLGAGGMAFVLSARHLDLDERFALKFLNEDLLREEVVVERFKREARAACKIRSEHVARVHDVGTHEGAPFMVMEHLSGRDLATVVRTTDRLSRTRSRTAPDVRGARGSALWASSTATSTREPVPGGTTAYRA